MRLLDRIIAIVAPPDPAAPPPTPGRSGHALLVFIPTAPDAPATDPRTSARTRGPAGRGTIPDLRVLQERLSRAMVLQHAGRFDGVAPVDSGVMLSFSGPNADRLAAVAIPILRAAHLPNGATATRRYGAPGARELHTALSP